MSLLSVLACLVSCISVTFTKKLCDNFELVFEIEGGNLMNMIVMATSGLMVPTGGSGVRSSSDAGLMAVRQEHSEIWKLHRRFESFKPRHKEAQGLSLCFFIFEYFINLVHIIRLDFEFCGQKALDVKRILGVIIRQVLVEWMICDVVLVGEEGANTS